MPLFFDELLRDGQIDRAMAVARSAVRDRADSWKPVLYTRLKSGRIWYEPGFGASTDDTVKWQGLISSMDRQRFVPIVGWGLAEDVYGSADELAAELARDNDIPVTGGMELPQVCQMLSVIQGSRAYARERLLQQMRKAIVERHGSSLPEGAQKAKLSELLREVGRLGRQSETAPYRLLAELPANIYLTSSPDDLLTEALTEAGKMPETMYPDWQDGVVEPPRDFTPTVETPLVYHLLGHWSQPDSVVLTEQDHSDFLVGIARNRNLIPAQVRRAINSASNWWLGFDPDSSVFRTFRSLFLSETGRATGEASSRIPAVG